MRKEEFMKIAWEKYSKWSKSQEGQTSGYEYEKTFDQMIVQMGRELLENETTASETRARKKKDKDAIR